MSREATTLLKHLRHEFRLDWHGIHGAAHWARVRFHGVSLARALGLDTRVPSLFGLLHDSQRQSEARDIDHGPRAAAYVGWLSRKGVIDLDSESLELLQVACHGHSRGLTDAHPIVQVCWDADRLDLGRGGVRPDPRYLCTRPAKDPERIERAWRWAQDWARRRRASH